MDKRTVFAVRSDIAQSQRTGQTLTVDRLFCPDWVNLIALTKDAAGQDSLICVRQWRFGRNEFSIEIPAGVMEKGESPQEAALRELKEETGYAPTTPGAVISLGQTWPNAAFMNNQMHTFFIPEVSRVAPPSPDPHEEIEIILLPLGDLSGAIADGHIRNAMVLVAFTLWKAYGANQSEDTFPKSPF